MGYYILILFVFVLYKYISVFVWIFKSHKNELLLKILKLKITGNTVLNLNPTYSYCLHIIFHAKPLFMGARVYGKK